MAKSEEKKAKGNYNASDHAGSGGVYFLGFIGAFVYYIVSTDGLWLIFLGFLKALVWPAILVYKLFELVY
jgi:hypothetical protein